MDDLSEFGIKYMTDKAPIGTYHAYTIRYQQLFEPIRFNVRRVLEIGIERGASLQMWRDYFPYAEVHGLDIVDYRSTLAGLDRIHVHFGDAKDPAVLAELAKEEWDIVVDDGSHNLDDMRDTCLALYPSTRSVYVIEDVHLAWWGSQLEGSLLSLCGRPEKLISRTTDERAAYIYDKRAVAC